MRRAMPGGTPVPSLCEPRVPKTEGVAATQPVLYSTVAGTNWLLKVEVLPGAQLPVSMLIGLSS